MALPCAELTPSADRSEMPRAWSTQPVQRDRQRGLPRDPRARRDARVLGEQRAWYGQRMADEGGEDGGKTGRTGFHLGTPLVLTVAVSDVFWIAPDNSNGVGGPAASTESRRSRD